jgi:hypothetical protein
MGMAFGTNRPFSSSLQAHHTTKANKMSAVSMVLLPGRFWGLPWSGCFCFQCYIGLAVLRSSLPCVPQIPANDFARGIFMGYL